MPWKPASGGGSNKSGAMRSKSIRGQISAPIPVADPLEQDVTNNNQTGTGQTNNSPPKSRPSTVLRQSPGRSTNPSSIATNSEQGPSRLSKSHAASPPERKKSTIRKVFGKLFGKRKSSSPSRTSKSSYGNTGPSHPQHRSDPTGESKPISGTFEPRANSVPVTEYDRALRSHSIGPEDVLAIQSARNSIAAEYSLTKRLPGAASPHAFGARYIGGGKLAGLSPRPASLNDRSPVTGVDDPDEIGMAVTSDSHGLKRRSRSLSAIPNFELVRPRRHKSDDLRLWRDSYDIDFLSPLSSNFPGDDDADTDDIHIVEPRASTMSQEPITPAQQFDFGDMAITGDSSQRDTIPAVPSYAPPEPDDRMQQIHDTIAKLDGGGGIYTTAPHWKDAERAGILGLGIEPSVADSNTTAGYLGRSMDIHTPSQHSVSSINDTLASSGANAMLLQATAKPTERPMSENTITGRRFLGDTVKQDSAPFTEEHYATLLGLLESERSARMALEAQVRHLAHQVSILMKHTAPGRNAEHVAGGDASISTTSAFDEDDDDDNYEGKRYSKDGYSRRTMDDSGIGSGIIHDDVDDDDTSMQSFATPHEQEDRTFGIYSPQHEEEDERAPRAMSLSQMTMGRVQTPVM